MSYEHLTEIQNDTQQGLDYNVVVDLGIVKPGNKVPFKKLYRGKTKILGFVPSCSCTDMWLEEVQVPGMDETWFAIKGNIDIALLSDWMKYVEMYHPDQGVPELLDHSVNAQIIWEVPNKKTDAAYIKREGTQWIYDRNPENSFTDLTFRYTVDLRNYDQGSQSINESLPTESPLQEENPAVASPTA